MQTKTCPRAQNAAQRKSAARESAPESNGLRFCCLLWAEFIVK
jgi:hypothetical protein